MDQQMRMAKMKERIKKKQQNKKFDGKTYSDGVVWKNISRRSTKKAEEAMKALLAEEEASENKKSKRRRKRRRERRIKKG